jgi:cytochrome c-type biogenesis protein
VLTDLLNNAGQYVHGNPWLALLAVFVGGMLTASNPCVLAMVPLMMGFVGGSREERLGVGRAFGLSLVFVLGLGLTFMVLGMIAALAGRMYGEISTAWNWVVAGVCVVMGLHLAGILKVPIPSLAGRVQPRTRGFLGALILGALFGLVSAPCAAPILVVLLTYLAGAGASLAWGGLLLMVYGLGHSVLILLAGTSMGAARTLIENRRATRTLAMVRRVAGLAVVAVGVYFATQALH